MEYHPAEVHPSGSGGDAEEEVWNALKESLGPDDNGVAYYRYPVIDKVGNRFDKEPDILVLHREIGLLVIEVKGYTIDQIERIEGPTWHLQGTNQSHSTPYMQAREQGFFVQSWFKREESLRTDSGRTRIPMNSVIALPNISRAEWEDRGFNEIPSTPRVITRDELPPQSLRRKLLGQPEGDYDLTSDDIQNARAVLSGSHVISGPRKPQPIDPTTKGDLYEKLIFGLKEFDETQETIGTEIPPGPQRIRGIAGSGKTIMIAKKAAHIHAKNPDWKVAVSFYTRSLYQTLEVLIDHFHRMMTGIEPNWENLQIMHGWGGKSTRMGLYYKVALESGIQPRNVNRAKKLSSGGPLELLDACCEEVLDDGDIPNLYNAILIDEGQDFGKHFYRMCYEALTENDHERRILIWAYDEAQTLGNLSVPSSADIFGMDGNDEPLVDLSGSYKNGIQRSHIMRKSYRAPREVLMLAHVFGMGLQRENGAVQAITRKRGWQTIGYEIEGNFRSEGEITLSRPDKYSPHPLQNEQAAKPFTKFAPFSDKGDEINWIASQIEQDVKERDLDAENILAIPLGDSNYAKSKGNQLMSELEERSISINRMWESSDDDFKKPGKVTLSRINRAKGNESSMVYLFNVEEVENRNRLAGKVNRRNQAFVGITRARAWCTITGTGDNLDVFSELEGIIDEVSSGEQKVFFPASNTRNVEREIESDVNATLEDF